MTSERAEGDATRSLVHLLFCFNKAHLSIVSEHYACRTTIWQRGQAKVFVQTMFETSKLLIELKTLGFLQISEKQQFVLNNQTKLITYNL